MYDRGWAMCGMFQYTLFKTDVKKSTAGTGETMKRNENGFIEIEIEEKIQWDEPNGEGCIVSDRITKDGWKVGYMVRDIPRENVPDSGWMFLKGDEDKKYMSDVSHHHIFSLNTVCNYDPDIIDYLHMPVGSALVRTEEGTFVMDDGKMPIYMEKQKRK